MKILEIIKKERGIIFCKETTCFLRRHLCCCLQLEISHSSICHNVFADKMINIASEEFNGKLRLTNIST